MALRPRATLKSYFQTNDFPTEQEFIDLIDSVPNFLDDGSAITYAIKLLIESADVLNLNTAPIDFIATPGANKFIQIISASIFLNWNSVIYAANTDVSFLTDTASISQYQNNIILSSNASVIGSSRIISIGALPNSQLITNKKVVITNVNGDPINGDSDITCYALYNIIDV